MYEIRSYFLKNLFVFRVLSFVCFCASDCAWTKTISTDFSADELALAASMQAYDLAPGRDGDWAAAKLRQWNVRHSQAFRVDPTPIYGRNIVVRTADGDCINILAVRGTLHMGAEVTFSERLCDWADCLSKGYLRLSHPAFRTFLDQFLSLNRCSTLMFTGHSLAGVMAQAAAKYSSQMANPEVVKDISLYTFNSPGAEDVMQMTALSRYQDVVSISGRHHRLSKDWVSRLGDHYKVPLLTWRRTKILGTPNDHSLQSFIEIFNEPEDMHSTLVNVEEDTVGRYYFSQETFNLAIIVNRIFSGVANLIRPRRKPRYTVCPIYFPDAQPLSFPVEEKH